MRHGRSTLLFTMLLMVAIVTLGVQLWGVRDTVAPLDQFVDVPHPEDLAAVDANLLRERARAATCADAVPIWWEIVARGDDPEAYKAIAICGRGARIDGVLEDTTQLLGRSRVLGLVPAMLDAFELRDLVPILNEVQATAGDAATLRQLGEIRQRLGDLDGAVVALQQALRLDPQDVESHVALGYALVESGRVDEARAAFRQGLAQERAGPRMTRMYAMAVAWPVPFVGIATALVGLAVSLGLRRDSELLGALDRSSGTLVEAQVLLWSVLCAAGLGAWFAYSGDRVAFGLLMVGALGASGWMAMSPLRAPLGRGIAWLGRQLGLLAAGRIHLKLAKLPPAVQVAILLVSTAAVVVFIPLVRDADVQIALLFLTAMLLFSTIGSLLLRLLDESRSLRHTLRWIGIAATLPFLLFFLNFERKSIADALFSGTLLDSEAQTRLAVYTLVWLLGLGFALLLARILATSILDPLGRVMSALERVRGGDFDVPAQVARRDEIGSLAGAVAEMAAGLRQREEMRQTFRRYVNPQVAERLMRGDDAVLRGRLVHATVLFSDVRGFTSMSERLGPAEIVELLNEYFARMEPVVRRWGGVVDKFLGDGMLAVWDVPEPIRDGPHADVPGERLAVEAALDMLDALRSFNEELAARGLRPLAIGIGINAGELIAGPVGSRDRQEYTVIGDTVNTAQRVETAARGASPLLVTEAVASVLEGGFALDPQEPVALKGKREALVLYAVSRLEPVAG